MYALEFETIFGVLYKKFGFHLYFCILGKHFLSFALSEVKKKNEIKLYKVFR